MMINFIITLSSCWAPLRWGPSRFQRLADELIIGVPISSCKHYLLKKENKFKVLLKRRAF